MRSSHFYSTFDELHELQPTPDSAQEIYPDSWISTDHGGPLATHRLPRQMTKGLTDRFPLG